MDSGDHRHQIFVVAKVNGLHRTLAVAHHQFLHGFEVVRCVVLLIEILWANANGIKRELERAAKAGLEPRRSW